MDPAAEVKYCSCSHTEPSPKQRSRWEATWTWSVAQGHCRAWSAWAQPLCPSEWGWPAVHPPTSPAPSGGTGTEWPDRKPLWSRAGGQSAVAVRSLESPQTVLRADPCSQRSQPGWCDADWQHTWKIVYSEWESLQIYSRSVINMVIIQNRLTTSGL